MRVRWRHLVFSAAATVAAGILVAWLGVIDIRASTGHWRVTDWFLHWAMRSSVRTASLGTEVPDLSNPAYLPPAAGHYEAACAGCHGSPERARSPVTMGMLPPPPALENVVGSWTDAQLFEIVKHGVRYTGMPAWPAQERDDEVWAMVAFLRRYPEIDADRYRRLAVLGQNQASADVQTLITGCDACHAASRLGKGSLTPMLDGQSETYLLESLQAFRSDQRASGIMKAALLGLDQNTLAELARIYAERPIRDRQEGVVPELVSIGDAKRGIPACSDCHDKAGVNPAFPRLIGLQGDYVRNQLRLFRDDKRGGTKFHQLMVRSGKNLTDEDIEALVRYHER